jgi:MFS family permease
MVVTRITSPRTFANSLVFQKFVLSFGSEFLKLPPLMLNTLPLLDIDGRPLTEGDIQRSMRVNIIAGLLGTVWGAMTVSYSLTLFMEAIGASGMAIGFLMTARQLVIAVQIPAAMAFENLPEHLGSRKRYWFLVTLPHRLLWFVVAALALCGKSGAWWLPGAVIGVVGLSELLSQSGSALWNSWMADLIPQKTAGRFWGRRQAIVTVGALIGMALAGFLLDRFRVPETGKTSMFGFSLVFSIAATFGAADVLVHCWVKEPRCAPIAPGAGIVERLLLPLRHRDFRHFTLAMGVWYAALAMYGPFSLVYLKREFPVTYTHIAALSIVGSLGAVFTCVSLGKLTDRFGPRVLCVLLLMTAPLTAASWFFIDTTYVTLYLPWLGPWSVPQVVLNQLPATFLSGALFAALFPCQVRLAALLSSHSGRTMAMAVHWSIIGLIASLGSILGGVIMDSFNAHPLHHIFWTGTSVSFFHLIVVAFALITWSVCVPLILSIKTPVDRVPFGKVFAWVVNPFNVIRSLGSGRTPGDEDD